MESNFILCFSLCMYQSIFLVFFREEACKCKRSWGNAKKSTGEWIPPLFSRVLTWRTCYETNMDLMFIGSFVVGQMLQRSWTVFLMHQANFQKTSNEFHHYDQWKSNTVSFAILVQILQQNIKFVLFQPNWKYNLTVIILPDPVLHVSTLQIVQII